MRLARVGVAVSGGGDSLALLHLLADWARDGGPCLAVVTVDHGRRPEAADEARAVARVAAGLGLNHETLRWQWNDVGNLQDQARRARLKLIGAWALERGLPAVALGHTADDQAETILLRLARGSGVDGLSGMAQVRRAGGINWLRPLLAARRADLRGYLQARGQVWADDPSNDDEGYDRIKARKALEVLAPLGITVEGLVATAGRMRLAREALQAEARSVARAHLQLAAGDVIFAVAELATAPLETQMRLMAGALCWVSGAEYRPRIEALQAMMAEVAAGRAATLHGCLILPQRGQARICREYQAVRETCCAVTDLWDGRWHFSGPDVAGAELRALGEAGLRACPDWRGAGVPRAALLASPAVWAGERLIAAPLANVANGWTAEAKLNDEGDFAALFMH